MKEKSIISAFTVISSIAGYYYAKHKELDSAPLVMISGFLGTLLGEMCVEMYNSNTVDTTQTEKQLQS